MNVDGALTRVAPEADGLTCDVTPAGDLGAGTRAAMYVLYARYYAAATRTRFQSDLDGKDRVLLLRDRAGALAGFSTLALQDTVAPDGTALRVIFSGDTIVDHRHWGQQALAFRWIEEAGRIAALYPEVPLYWFLIVKGHRTFRYLNAFTHTYHPHPRRSTPRETQILLDALARERFGEHYDAERGVVRFPRSRGHLRAPWSGADARERRRPEVAYFLERNPGFARGHELVCLTRLQGENLRPLARRLFERGACA